MRLAIVGSTCLAGNDEARRLVHRIIEDHMLLLDGEAEGLVIVSGGAIGIDSIAEEEARRLGVVAVVFPPGREGWRWYRERNLRIAEFCTHLIRIVGDCSTTYGSGWTRDRAREMGKPVREFVVSAAGVQELRPA